MASFTLTDVRISQITVTVDDEVFLRVVSGMLPTEVVTEMSRQVKAYSPSPQSDAREDEVYASTEEASQFLKHDVLSNDTRRVLKALYLSNGGMTMEELQRATGLSQHQIAALFGNMIQRQRRAAAGADIHPLFFWQDDGKTRDMVPGLRQALDRLPADIASDW